MQDGTVSQPQPNDKSIDELMAELVAEDEAIYNRKQDSDVQGMRVKIQMNNVPLEEQTEFAIRALHNFNKPPKLFTRACSLCRVKYDEMNVALIEPLDKYALRYYMARSAFFVKISHDKRTNTFNETHFAPSMDVVYDILASSVHEFPQLIALSETPIIRPDGEICSSIGYDPLTMLYFAPSNGCKFPELIIDPQPGDILTAVNLIKEIFEDFPFVDETSKTNAIAALITPILRPLINGCIPMCVIDKPQAGTGASLLSDAISIVATGKEMAAITEQKTEEEWQKVITSILRGGRVLITLDNVEGKLRAPSLASLLTSSMYQGRILGKSEMVTFPNRTAWIANGNNIQLGGDLPRRCYTVKLDAKSAQPWLRKIQFKHPDLRGWVYENRGWIVNAIITITRAWIRDNKPIPDNQVVLGGFEEWCTVVGGVLNYAGITGFLGNLEDMYENMDQDTIQWESFLLAWYECYGNKEIGVSEIYDRLKHETNSNETLFKEQALYSSLPDWLGDEFNKKSSFVRKLGKALSKKDGVCYSCGLKLVRGITKKRAVMWSVVVWDNELWISKVGENNG